MYRYAMIDPITNLVKNVVIWDGKKEWSPAKTHLMVKSDLANIGDKFDPKTDSFISPQRGQKEE